MPLQCALPAMVETCNDANSTANFSGFMDRPVITGTVGSEMGRYDVHITEEIPCWHDSPLHQLIRRKRGDVPSPPLLCFWEKKEYPPGRWIKRASAAEAGADGPAGRAHPCDHILLSWSVASWSSFSETSQLIRGSLLVCIPAASPGGCVFHQPGQALKPVLRTSSTELFLQSCDSKEPKRLTEAGS